MSAGRGPDRLKAAFDRCRAEERAALVAYVMGGDPDLKGSAAMALACAQGGADVLELGIPFSDPIADGPTIQRAAERALGKGATLRGVLEVAAQVRAKTDVPIVLMGYVNPVLSYGLAAFFSRCAEVGVDGVILPDLPPEEAQEVCALAREHAVATIFLLAPTSTPERQRAAAEAATGFLYFVSVTGVTGARADLPADLAAQVSQVKALGELPVVVGFGISDPDQARAVSAFADGVVVGSAIVSRVAEPGSTAARAARVRKFVGSLRRGLSAGPTPARRARVR